MDLAPIREPSLVVSTIAQVLGVIEAAGQPLLDQLSASLREKEVLLLLDNFEQVVGAAPEGGNATGSLSQAQRAGHQPSCTACAMESRSSWFPH